MLPERTLRRSAGVPPEDQGSRPAAGRRALFGWLLVFWGAAQIGGCAHARTTVSAALTREVVLSYDDNRASATLAFPNMAYESLIRYALPPGKHRPLRLRALVAHSGTMEITLYANGLLESPAAPIRAATWTVSSDDVSTGKDGRWVVSDLQSLPPLEGVVWVGVRKLGGDPALWTSSVGSGQTFLRDRTPGNSMGILPVRRTPMLRVELLLDPRATNP
jgi:hypothetical protein